MKDVIKFLELNGFKQQNSEYCFENDKCKVWILDPKYSQETYYCIQTEEFCYYTPNAIIYHLIGYLTYYGLIDKNYKQI